MFVYADNAATMPLSKRALEAMMPFLTDNYGNASSMYALARTSKRAMEDARKSIAAALGAQPEEIYFTAGGTEADNWALKGACQARASRGKHIITTVIEHHAVLHTVEYLKKYEGYDVTFLPVDESGLVTPEQVEQALRADTILVSVMMANNEVGALEPIAETGALCRARGVWFHTDAVQAVGHIPIDLSQMNVDMMSMAAHKFGGPKGIGAFYLRRGVRIPTLLHGGGHERGLRSGTENVAGAVGMAAALAESIEGLDEKMMRVSGMRDKLIAGLLKIPYAALTGHPTRRLPGNASFVFECVEGESLVLGLDAVGVCSSSGSACSSGSLDPSHVLLAIGLPHEIAHGSLRLSLSEHNTDEEIDYLIEKVTATVERGRSMSPLWDVKEQKPTVRFWNR